MKNSKIIDLLKTFSKAEWRDCTNFLAWKYKEKGIEWELFKHIKKYRGDWENDALEIRATNKKIAPGLEKNRFLEKRAYLKAKIETFLIHNRQETATYKIEKYRLLGDIYKERGLYHLYKDLQNPIERSTKKLITNDLFTDLKLLLWQHQRYFSEIMSVADKIDFLEKSSYRLEQFYQNLKGYYETEAENMSQIYNKKAILSQYPIEGQLNEILTALDKLVRGKDVTSFNFLKADLEQNTTDYSKELQQVLLISLINTCNYFIRIKDDSYRQKMLELYEFGLDSGIVLNNGKLSERRFLNMVDVKSKVANSTDSMDFIDAWLKLTHTKHEKTLKNLANAIWYFAKDDYKKAYENTRLLEITLKDINISHRVRLIKLCSLYSVDNKYPFFKQELKSARDFYTYTEKRKKLNSTIISGARNLITILEKLWGQRSYQELMDFKMTCTYIVHEAWIEKLLAKMVQKK